MADSVITDKRMELVISVDHQRLPIVCVLFDEPPSIRMEGLKSLKKTKTKRRFIMSNTSNVKEHVNIEITYCVE